jgi:membrane protein DedA with SNARE-associated domain
VIFDLFLTFLGSLHGLALYALVFTGLFGAGIGAPLSQDVLLLLAAGLTLQGELQALPLMLAAWAALLAADALTFWTGRYYGARWIRQPWARGIVAPERLPALQAWMQRWGAVLAFVTRFLPGQRGTLYFIAGTLRLSWGRLLLWDGLAALLEVPLVLYGVRSLGWQWQRWQVPVDHADDLLTLGLVIVLLLAWSRERRRRLSAR